MIFDIGFTSVQLAYEPLLHPDVKVFTSPFESIRELLDFKNFNGGTDSRLGHIILCVPNLNARLDQLVLKDNPLALASGSRNPALAIRSPRRRYRGRYSGARAFCFP